MNWAQFSSGADDAVEHDQELSHGGDEGDHFPFSSLKQDAW